MAYCKYLDVLTPQEGTEFDDLHGPGTIAPLAGVYRCEACARSIVAHNAQPLPPEHHHRHEDGEPILWRLAVRSHFG